MRLEMGIAIPRDVGGPASGLAAVKDKRMAKTKECEKSISDWNQLNRLQRERERPLEDMGDASNAFIQVGGPLRKGEVAGYRAESRENWAFPVPKQTTCALHRATA